jgi:hypothetical protein
MDGYGCRHGPFLQQCVLLLFTLPMLHRDWSVFTTPQTTCYFTLPKGRSIHSAETSLLSSGDVLIPRVHRMLLLITLIVMAMFPLRASYTVLLSLYVMVINHPDVRVHALCVPIIFCPFPIQMFGPSLLCMLATVPDPLSGTITIDLLLVLLPCSTFPPLFV